MKNKRIEKVITEMHELQFLCIEKGYSSQVMVCQDHVLMALFISNEMCELASYNLNYDRKEFNRLKRIIRKAIKWHLNPNQF